MSFKPTEEQAAIIDAVSTGDNLVVEAAAGAGKTSTLRLVAEANPGRRGLYLAYNRAIKDEAVESFPGTVDCKTAHGLAYGPVGSKYRHRLNGPRVPAQQAAIILGIKGPLQLVDGQAPLAPAQLARMVTATVQRFCYSADMEIGPKHVPTYPGLEDPKVHAALVKFLLPYAQLAWADLTDEHRGRLRYTHDTYLKQFQLLRPDLSRYDYILFDEAQDANPVTKALVEAQDSQLVLVGDRNQQLYAWRGAVDAMSAFDGKRLFLTKSFRFGPAIADEANKWLELLDAEIRVRGHEPVGSRVEECPTPDAVLCRSNAVALRTVIDNIRGGRRTALVGEGKDLQALARAAQDLQTKGSTDHPELLAFTSWKQVQDYTEREEGDSDLKVLVRLVDQHGPDDLLSILDRLTPERYADVTVSTAHKAKGREWNKVKVADDFREPKPADDGGLGMVAPADAMLAYVTVTRAKKVLDRSGLEWVDAYLAQAPADAGLPMTAEVYDDEPVESPEESAAIVNANLAAMGSAGLVEPEQPDDGGYAEARAEAEEAYAAEDEAAGREPLPWRDQPALMEAPPRQRAHCFLCDPRERKLWPAPAPFGGA